MLKQGTARTIPIPFQLDLLGQESLQNNQTKRNRNEKYPYLFQTLCPQETIRQKRSIKVSSPYNSKPIYIINGVPKNNKQSNLSKLFQNPQTRIYFYRQNENTQNEKTNLTIEPIKKICRKGNRNISLEQSFYRAIHLTTLRGTRRAIVQCEDKKQFPVRQLQLRKLQSKVQNPYTFSAPQRQAKIYTEPRNNEKFSNNITIQTLLNENNCRIDGWNTRNEPEVTE